ETATALELVSPVDPCGDIGSPTAVTVGDPFFVSPSRRTAAGTTSQLAAQRPAVCSRILGLGGSDLKRRALHVVVSFSTGAHHPLDVVHRVPLSIHRICG